MHLLIVCNTKLVGKRFIWIPQPLLVSFGITLVRNLNGTYSCILGNLTRIQFFDDLYTYLFKKVFNTDVGICDVIPFMLSKMFDITIVILEPNNHNRKTEVRFSDTSSTRTVYLCKPSPIHYDALLPKPKQIVPTV